jgi:hypothetical protein
MADSANPQATVTRLENGGYDVEFEGGGRVILEKGEAKSKAEAEQVARERHESNNQIHQDAEDAADESAAKADDDTTTPPATGDKTGDVTGNEDDKES